MRTVPFLPDRERRGPPATGARLRRSAGPSSENQCVDIELDQLEQPQPQPQPRLTVARHRHSAGPSNANQIERFELAEQPEQPEQSQRSGRQQRPKRSKNKAREHVFKKTLKDYCTNSMVHGLRYFTEPKRHWVERVWWAIVVSASISISGLAMHRTWTNWNEHPVIISFDDKVTPISSIPFPAVTICPTKKFHKEKVNFAKIKAALSGASRGNRSALKDLSPKELSQANAIGQTCLLPHSFPKDLIISSDPSIYDTIEDIMPRKRSSIDYYIRWNFQFNKYKLEIIFTDDGLCYTFNSLNSHQIYADGIAPDLLSVRDNPNATHWNREDGYPSNVDESVYPYHSLIPDMNSGFGAEFRNVFDDSDKFCSPFATGLHVSLHTPDELPQSRNNFIHIPPEQLNFISVIPNVITTSNDLRSYDPHQRDCYFQSERGLRFFRSYSEQKCQSECLANFTKNQCDCVHFSMPRDKNTKVCTTVEMECYRAAKQRFDKHHIVKQCDCLSDCFAISYNAEKSQAPYVNYLYDERKENRTGFSAKSLFLVSFKEENFIVVNRSESSTIWDFLSSCGGILGLFLGISVLSIVELIYYFTLRLWCNWKRQKKVHPIAAPAPAPDQTIRPSIGLETVKNYCTDSTVHGLRYFTEPMRHRAERVWWAVAVAASVIFCGVIIQRIWTNWNENPVIVSFDDKLTPIDQIPFPAITICPNKKFIMQNVNADKLFKTGDQLVASGHTTLDSMSPEEISQLDAIMQTIHFIPNLPSNFSIPSNKMIYDAIRNITLEPNSTIQSIDWRNQPNQFKFKPIFTAQGLCYTFNSLNSRQIYSDVVEPELLTVRDNPDTTHWNREDGYRSNVNESDVYPYRVFGSDVFDELNVRLGIVLDYHYETAAVRLPPGFQIVFHAPDESPLKSNSILLIPSEHDVHISIRPETITTSDGLRSYPPHVRGCYFESERQLRFFKSYSQLKCELECGTNFITNECGCTHFAFPREKNTRICTMADMSQYTDAIIKFEMLVTQCDCLPDCTSIVYHTEVSQSPYHQYDDEVVKKIKKSYKHLGYLAHSKLHISFKEKNFISVNRSESSTIWDFLSDCGGLLGLFMGVSAISIVEVVYYFTLRLGVNWWRRQQESGQPNVFVLIKRRCFAFMVKQWQKVKEQKRQFVAFIQRQWVKLGKFSRDCGAFIANQWEKLRQQF